MQCRPWGVSTRLSDATAGCRISRHLRNPNRINMREGSLLRLAGAIPLHPRSRSGPPEAQVGSALPPSRGAMRGAHNRGTIDGGLGNDLGSPSPVSPPLKEGTMAGSGSVVLVHGGFVDGSGWQAGLPPAQGRRLQRQRRPEPDALARRRRCRDQARRRRAERAGHPRWSFLWRSGDHRGRQ